MCVFFSIDNLLYVLPQKCYFSHGMISTLFSPCFTWNASDATVAQQEVLEQIRVIIIYKSLSFTVLLYTGLIFQTSFLIWFLDWRCNAQHEFDWVPPSAGPVSWKNSQKQSKDTFQLWLGLKENSSWFPFQQVSIQKYNLLWARQNESFHNVTNISK